MYSNNHTVILLFIISQNAFSPLKLIKNDSKPIIKKQYDQVK